jgi:hypothetical protein
MNQKLKQKIRVNDAAKQPDWDGVDGCGDNFSP